MLKLVWPEVKVGMQHVVSLRLSYYCMCLLPVKKGNTHGQDGFSPNNYMWVFVRYLITVLTLYTHTQ